MKYWLLTTEYPPFHGGGIATYCYLTAKMLSLNGHEVTVFTPGASVHDFTVTTKERVSIVNFNINRNQHGSALGYSARLSYAFAEIVKYFVQREGKPDYIETQDYLGIAYYLLQFKLAGYESFQIPVVLTLHSPAFLYLEYNRVATYQFPDFWTCEMEKQSIIAADHLISPSRFLPEALEKYVDLSSKQINIIPNPYEDDELERKADIQRNKIVFFGKLSPQKGVFELLDYFKQIWDEGGDYSLELIGGTDIVYHPEQKTMGQIVREKYRTYIAKGFLKITGKISPASITSKLQDAHVIVIPSIVDNLPYAVIEAMSRGKLVLASVQGGQREIIEHEVDGFLFDHKKAGDFKHQLFKILSLSNQEIGQYGENAARKIRSNYSLEVVYARKVELLKSFPDLNQQQKSFPFVHQEVYTPLEPAANPLLSVVIPFYNLGAYLTDCVNSILQSTYTPIEIIIVNDGSTEQSSLAALKNMIQYPQVTVFDNKNQGVAISRNFGSEKASGSYLAFLDADDKVSPTYYEKAVKVLKQYENVFFVGAWAQYFENSSNVWPAFTPQPPYALVHNPVNSSALVYKKAAYITAGQNDKDVGYGLEDYESVIALMAKGYNGFVLPECHFYYRVRSGSMIRSINHNKLIYSNKYIAEKHKSYYAKFATQIINVLNANGPGYQYDNPTKPQTGLLNSRLFGPLYDELKTFINARPKVKNALLRIIKVARP